MKEPVYNPASNIFVFFGIYHIDSEIFFSSAFEPFDRAAAVGSYLYPRNDSSKWTTLNGSLARNDLTPVTAVRELFLRLSEDGMSSGEGNNVHIVSPNSDVYKKLLMLALLKHEDLREAFPCYYYWDDLFAGFAQPAFVSNMALSTVTLFRDRENFSVRRFLSLIGETTAGRTMEENIRGMCDFLPLGLEGTRAS